MDSRLDHDQNSLHQCSLYFPQLLGLRLAGEWEPPPEWCGRMESHGRCPRLGGRVPHSRPGSAPSTWASLGQQLCRLSETQFTLRLKQEPAGRRARERQGSQCQVSLLSSTACALLSGPILGLRQLCPRAPQPRAKACASERQGQVWSLLRASACPGVDP